MPQKAGMEKCVRSTAGGRTFLRPEGRAPGRGLPRYFGIRDETSESATDAALMLACAVCALPDSDYSAARCAQLAPLREQLATVDLRNRARRK